MSLLNETDLPGGPVEFGNLRRVTPITRSFGFERGQPIDRYYIERFLARHSADVFGRVMEIGDNEYTRRFGGTRATQSDILSLTSDNPNATLVADLTSADHVPSAIFDCIIFTQTLHFIYDVQAAVRTLHRMLKPAACCWAHFPRSARFAATTWTAGATTGVLPAPRSTVCLATCLARNR